MQSGNLLISQSNYLYNKTSHVIKDILKTHKIVDLNLNYKDLHTKSLKNTNNQILENIWQSCKVYKETIPCLHKKYNTILWKHPKEIHITDDNKLTKEYFLWKDKLMNNKYPIEYPTGISNKNKYHYIIDDNDNIYKGSKGYHDAFKKIYVNLYLDSIKTNPRFYDLKKEYLNGQNILITCEKLPYYPIKFNPETVYYSSGYCLGLALYYSDLMK